MKNNDINLLLNPMSEEEEKQFLGETGEDDQSPSINDLQKEPKKEIKKKRKTNPIDHGLRI